MIDGNVEETILLVQLLDNSVFHVKRVGGEKSLPTKAADVSYHVERRLTVATKEEVKELFGAIVPILKVGGDCRKIILSPLGRSWKSPCCNNPDHHINFSEPGYLRELGNATYRIREYLRDFTFMKRMRKFRALCPNRLIGMGERLNDPDVDNLRVVTESWGSDTVNPDTATQSRRK